MTGLYIRAIALTKQLESLTAARKMTASLWPNTEKSPPSGRKLLPLRSHPQAEAEQRSLWQKQNSEASGSNDVARWSPHTFSGPR